MPVIDGLPVPEPLRQIPPRAPRPDPAEHSVDHQPVIIPPVPLPRMTRQQRLQLHPLRITEIMPLQPVIIHGAIQAEMTRPRRWGGFRVVPTRVEFWQESPDGLHDRIRYRRGDGGWISERLSP